MKKENALEITWKLNKHGKVIFGSKQKVPSDFRIWSFGKWVKVKQWM
jgi:hypothetical protein